jgi:hypothetical protein
MPIILLDKFIDGEILMNRSNNFYKILISVFITNLIIFSILSFGCSSFDSLDKNNIASDLNFLDQGQPLPDKDNTIEENLPGDLPPTAIGLICNSRSTCSLCGNITQMNNR